MIKFVGAIVYGYDETDNELVLLDVEVNNPNASKEIEKTIASVLIENLERQYPHSPSLQINLRKIANNDQAFYQNELGFHPVDKDLKDTAYKQKLLSWPGEYIGYERDNQAYLAQNKHDSGRTSR